MSKLNQQAELQPLWKRIGKVAIGAGITAAYITGIVLAAPITLSITAALGAARGLVQRKDGQKLLSSLSKGMVQGIVAPFAASATLTIDAIKGQETGIISLVKDSGRKMPDILGFKQNDPEQKQPLWKRIAKVAAGVALIGGTIAACVVAGPAVAAAAAITAVTGGYKGYKEAKKEGKSGIFGAIKGAVNRVISPLTSSAILIAHGVQGCKTDTLKVNVFKDFKKQMMPQNMSVASNTNHPVAPAFSSQVSQMQIQGAVNSLGSTQIKVEAIKSHLLNRKPPPLPPKLTAERRKIILDRVEAKKKAASGRG